MFDDEPNEQGPSSLERAQEYMAANPLETEEKPPETPPAKTPEEIAAEGKQPEGQQPPAKEPTPEEKAAAEAKAKEQAPPALDEKAVLEHPKVKEIQQAFDDNKKVLDEFSSIIHANPDFDITSPEVLRDTLADAHALYNIALGKAKVSDLLDLFEKNWKPESFQAVMLDLQDYLAAKGIKATELDPRKPEHRELIALRNESNERRQAETQAAVEKTREKAISTLQTSVKALCEKNGVDAQDVMDYALVLSAKIGSDAKLLKLLEQGKAGAEIERLFTEHHNRELARQKRWLDAKVAAKDKREEELPRVPARGGAPTPKGTEKPFKDRSELGTAEGRIAAAKRYMDGTKASA